MRPMRYAPEHRGGNGANHIIFMFVFIIFLAAVIFGLVFLINRYARHNNIATSTDSDPVGIAKARYARGEITKEEFNQLKKDLA